MNFAQPLCRVRAPHPAWQQALDAIAPPHPLKSRLVVRWHPGRAFIPDGAAAFVWQPIERWVVWELIPTAQMSPRFPAVMRMLGQEEDGGAPRRALNGVHGGLELDRGFVDRAQWALYRETGQYGRMAWIVQGTRGGHQRVFSEPQRLGLARRGLPEEPPYPGELPYADFDGRVLQQLALRQRSLVWTAISEKADRIWHNLDHEEQAQALDARRALVDWSEEQMYDVLDSSTRKERQEFRDSFPHGLGRPDHLEADAEELLASFIEGAEE